MPSDHPGVSFDTAYLDPNGELRDVQLDGDSLWPIWFKVEWKGNGHIGAKIAGERLSTREGDEIRFLIGAAEELPSPSGAQRERRG